MSEQAARPTPSDSPPPPPAEAPSAGPPSLPVTPAADRKIERRIRIACLFSLLALGLIVWSLVDPRPLPVVAAMTIGQAVGTLSLLFFIGSILLDLRARRVLARLNRR